MCNNLTCYLIVSLVFKVASLGQIKCPSVLTGKGPVIASLTADSVSICWPTVKQLAAFVTVSFFPHNFYARSIETLKRNLSSFFYNSLRHHSYFDNSVTKKAITFKRSPTQRQF